jgi:hypothetical protein
VSTDKPYYFAGETVTGKIYLSLVEAFSANCLEIEVKGKEKTKWYTHRQVERGTGENKRTERETRRHTGEYKTFYYRCPLYSFGGQRAEAGQYTYPFSFTLPPFLPSSIYYRGQGE